MGKCKFVVIAITSALIVTALFALRKIRGRRGKPIKLGPLTKVVLSRRRWTDAYPSWQCFADEAERLFTFADRNGQFKRYLSDLVASISQRDAALAELRVAYCLNEQRFAIKAWKPVGNQSKEGEFLIEGPSKTSIFVEVKGPTWEGELSDFGATSLTMQQQQGVIQRIGQGKYVDGDGGAITPWKAIQFAVKKAYPKFTSNIPNLLVIADDLKVSLEHGTELMAGTALYDKSTQGCFVDSAYENCGGVGIFWWEIHSDSISYQMRLFLNPQALQATAIPYDLKTIFDGKIL